MRLRKPTPAFVVAVAALVVSLGGTSYAVATIGSADIRDGSIQTKDLKLDAVHSPQIADGTLLPQDFKFGTLKRGPVGPQGPPGTPGADGDDGADGADGIGRWALVDADGVIVAQSGGFEIRSAYDLVNNTGAVVPGGAFGNVYIDANEDLTDNGIVTTIALQNQLDQNADGIKNGRADGPDLNPEFSGEITTTMCAIPMVVGCAPVGANDTNHFVVSPRNSDGSVTTTGTHKRFYVIITGDSSDYVAP